MALNKLGVIMTLASHIAGQRPSASDIYLTCSLCLCDSNCPQTQVLDWLL